MKFNLRSGRTATECFATVQDDLACNVQSNFEQVGFEVAETIRNLKVYDFEAEKPTILVSTETDATLKAAEDRVNEIIFKEETKLWVKSQAHYKPGLLRAYNLVMETYMGVALKDRIEAETDYDTSIKGNLIALLKRVRDLTRQTDQNRNPYMAIIETMARMVNLKQQGNEDLIAYYKRFKDQRDIVTEQIGNSFLESFVESTPEYKNLQGDKIKEAELKKEAMNKFYGALLLRNSDRRKYGTLLTLLESQYSMGQDQYPRSLEAAFKVLDFA